MKKITLVCILCLFLTVACATNNEGAKKVGSGGKLLRGFLQIDDVHLIPRAEQIRLHPRVPLFRLVAKVDAGFDEIFEQFSIHGSVPFANTILERTARNPIRQQGR